MSGRHGIRLLAICTALVALVLLAGIGTVAAAPPSEMVTIEADWDDCTTGKVATLGTAENYELPGCYASLPVPLLAFGDFDATPCGRERWRGFLQFELGDLPPHSRIVDAELGVYVNFLFLPTPGSVKVGVHRITEAWDPGSTSFIWPGPAYTPPAKWQTITNGQTLYTWDVKQIVKAWARGEPNHGFAFVAKKEGSNANIVAACPDCWLAGQGRPSYIPPPPEDELNKATLTVTYVMPPGLE